MPRWKLTARRREPCSAGRHHSPTCTRSIKAFHARGALVASVRLMRDHCHRYPRDSTKMWLKLAQVLMCDCQRPRPRGRSSRRSPPVCSPGTSRKPGMKLVRQAETMLEEGVLEVEGDD